MHRDSSTTERRATLLHAAAQVSKSVSSILDHDQLLKQTVDVICDEFGFYYAGVFLVDETSEWAVLRAGRGEAGAAMLAKGHKLQVGGNSMIGASVSQHRAIIALDVGEEPVRFDNPFLPETRSEMALPLIAGEQVIGALTVQSTEEAAFDDDDIMALQAMADQLAIAMSNASLYDENRRLLERSERRARLLEAAAEVGHGVTSILDLDELLSHTVDIICDAYGFYFSCVYLLDEDRAWLVLSAAHGQAGQQMLASGHRLKVGGQSMNGTVAVQRKARIALDVDQDPVHMKNPLLPHTRSEMVMPLLVGDDIIGTLAVQSTEEAAFDEDDITSLQAMADQLAIAINNARLYNENQRLLARSERRARLLEAASKVGHGVTSILDLDELLGRTVDIICDAYGFYFSCVYLLDDSGKWLILRAGYGEAGEQMLAKKHKLLVGGKSMNGTVAVQRKARIALDVDQDPVHMKNPLLPHTRSEMVMPLLVGNDIIGTLAVQSTEGAAFDEDDITSLQTMADQLAIAINNAQLLRDLKAAHAELVRTKTFEAIATSTIEAIHWIGNKALPISNSVTRVLEDLVDLAGDDADQDLLVSIIEDLDMTKNSAELISSVKEHLIGPAREEKPRPAMLDDVVKDAAVALGVPQEIVSYKVARDLPLAWADTTQLSRAFGYVLRNAVEAVEDRSHKKITVTVTPTEERDYVAVSISDNGPGIPKEDLDRIWATFYTTKGTEHAGLGLSACLQIVKQLDGQVAAGNAPAGGAQIEIRIPAFDGVLSSATLPAGRSVLLVDDDDAWCRFVQATWTQAGSQVVRSPDGKVDPALFDLIVVDDVLEQTNSIDVLKRLRASKATAKTLIVASSLRVERTMQLMHFGVKDIVLKPYTMAALAAILA